MVREMCAVNFALLLGNFKSSHTASFFQSPLCFTHLLVMKILPFYLIRVYSAIRYYLTFKKECKRIRFNISLVYVDINLALFVVLSTLFKALIAKCDEISWYAFHPYISTACRFNCEDVNH